ncbi:MAG: ATP-binding protein [bacterium]
MIFKELEISNYRQYKDITLNLENKSLHVFIAVMGTGKSNLLNAINWCLYGDEPFLSIEDKEDSKPRINTSLIDKLNEGEEETATVKLVTELENGDIITFKRTELYKFINNNGLKPKKIDNELEVITSDNQNNTKFITGEDEVTNYVERFIPRDIRNYFFFEGENLDKYFEAAAPTEKIREAVENISQVTLLDRIIYRLGNISDYFSNQIGDNDSEIKGINDEISELKTKISNIIDRINDCKEQKEIAEKKINDLEDKIRNKPDVRVYQENIDELREQKKNKENILEQKKNRKEKLIFNYAPCILLYDNLTKLDEYIENKKKTKVFPQTNDENLIKNILKENTCICGRDFEKNSNEAESLQEILDKIEYSNNALNDLTMMQGTIKRTQEEVEEYLNKINNITKDIKNLEKELTAIEDKLADNKQKLKNIDKDEVANWYEKLEKNIKLNKELEDNLERLKNRKLSFESEIDEKKEERMKEIEKKNEYKKLTEQMKFANLAINKARNAKNKIMKKIKDKITEQTNKKFFNLMWKQETYSKVEINDDYSMSLYDNNGFDSLNSLSGGEIEVLALSFTLALQTISGFNAPMVIDRPLAMVSGPSRKGIAQILVKLAKDKQVILLLTPNDYSDIMNILDCEHGQRWDMNLYNEEEIYIEEAY